MKTTITNGTMNQEEYWHITPTPTLRWVEKEIPVEIDRDTLQPISYRTERTLQQMWQGSKGSIKWEDVPTIKEEEIR